MWTDKTPSHECHQYSAVVGKKLTLAVGDDESYNFIRFSYDEAIELGQGIIEAAQTMRDLKVQPRDG